ncbi:MAG: IS5 family transposase [Oscillospiraceae bacterium]|nr:IS5 family transposase [Oscillospiraceae bacterium]
MGKQIKIFGAEQQLARLSKMGDSLEKINEAIDWEIFRAPIRERTRKADYSKGGRPPWEEILMFKTTLLQDWNNLSDENTEYMINDRLTFQRFLGLEIGEKAPDEKTIWLFKEQLGKEGMMELFELFNEKLVSLGLVKREGSLIDATFVDAPKQRNSREENAKIKRGEIPEEWRTPENVNKLEQKDTDARWTKKGNELHYGYKDHVKVDNKSKIIIDFAVTSANVHDINEFEGLIDINDTEAWLDSGYASEDHVARIKGRYPDIILHICEKGYKNAPLSEEQKESNREKSKVRARVEHVFGYMTRFMGGITIRTIGMARAEREICGMNLAYNIRRSVFLTRAKPILT